MMNNSYFFRQHPLPVFKSVDCVLKTKHIIAYGNQIDALGSSSFFYIFNFLKNDCKSCSDIPGMIF